jgi:hypothetical protein
MQKARKRLLIAAALALAVTGASAEAPKWVTPAPGSVSPQVGETVAFRSPYPACIDFDNALELDTYWRRGRGGSTGELMAHRFMVGHDGCMWLDPNDALPVLEVRDVYGPPSIAVCLRPPSYDFWLKPPRDPAAAAKECVWTFILAKDDRR